MLTNNHKKSIKKEACWTISNITAGNREQIQVIILLFLRGMFRVSRCIEFLMVGMINVTISKWNVSSATLGYIFNLEDSLVVLFIFSYYSVLQSRFWPYLDESRLQYTCELLCSFWIKQLMGSTQDIRVSWFHNIFVFGWMRNSLRKTILLESRMHTFQTSRTQQGGVKNPSGNLAMASKHVVKWSLL